jgi:hypothetical protein
LPATFPEQIQSATPDSPLNTSSFGGSDCPHCHPAEISVRLNSFFAGTVFGGYPFADRVRKTVTVPLIEHLPPEPVADPLIEQRWTELCEDFRKAALEGDDSLQQILFAQIVDLAVNRLNLRGSFDELEKSREILRALETQKERSDDYFHSTLACHAATADIGMGLLSLQELMRLVDEQKNVVAARERIRSESLDKLENDLLFILEEAGAGMPFDDGLPPEKTLSPTAASMFGDIFKSLNDYERARKYYNLAAISPVQTATGAVWYRLQALQIDVMEGDKEKIKGAVLEIEQIRDGLTNLLLLTYGSVIDEAVKPEGEGNVVGMDLEGGIPVPAGTPEQVHQIDAMSWGVLYDAYNHLEENGKMEALEEERRLMVRGRIGEADVFESLLHVQNFERVTLNKTVRGGAIERALREDGLFAALDVHKTLTKDLRDIQVLIDSNMKQERGDPLFEGLAALYWTIYFNGYFSMDLPQKALKSLNENIIMARNAFDDVPLADTHIIEYKLSELRGLAPHIFNDDGTLNPDVDMSDTPEGKEAADRLMTAYWRSNDTAREIGLPVGTAVAGFILASIFSEGLLIPVLVGMAAGGGGSLLNREINEASASEQYRQALATGLTQITDREARANRNTWYLMEGMNAIFNATLMAPMFSVWGRAGIAAAESGLGRGLTWLAAQGGSRALASSAWRPLGVAANAAKGAYQGIKTASGWFWKLPVGTRLRLAGALPAAADYGFINGGGDLVSWDGQLDHWYGYAGLAGLASEGGYQLFSRTWRPSFASAVQNSAFRRGLIRAGADAAAFDYYILDDDYNLIDFGAPRNTPFEEHAFDEQFAIDTLIGNGGLILIGGDWLAQEIRTMSWFERSLLAAGAGGIVYDVSENGEFDSPVGGIGGSVLVADLSYRLMNVDPVGSLAFLPFRILGEWTVQAMHDVPIQAPDPQRLMSSTLESAFMLMVVKGIYQGNHYWYTFPLGRFIASAGSRLPVVRNLRSIQDMGLYSFLGGNKSSIDGWTNGVRVKPLSTRSTGNGNGRSVEINYRLRGDKAWNGLAEGSADVHLRVVSEAGFAPRFFANGEHVDASFMASHGYIWRGGNLYEFQPIRSGYIEIGGSRMTAQQIRGLTDEARARTFSELKQKGWRISGSHFERWWIERPYHPEILLERPPQMSTAQFKVFESSLNVNGETVPVWLKFSRRTITADEVSLGGRRFVLWRGQREKPQFTFWGVMMQGPPVIGSAYASNYLIFHHVARGDPEYQPLQRMALYVPTVFFTWPVVQAPLGLDTWRARITGTAFGQFFLMGANWLYPSYRNTAPGQETLYELLDAGGSIDRPWYHPNSDNAFDSMDRIVTSLNPGFWGPAHGCLYEIEEAAMQNLITGLDCRMDMARGTQLGNSDDCIMLPEATQQQIRRLDPDVDMETMKKRFDAWSSLFREKIEEERAADLSERERRVLIMLGAWFKYIKGEYSGDETISSIEEVCREYKWFFEQIPALRTEREWEDFISQVNSGKAEISDFYFDPRLR